MSNCLECIKKINNGIFDEKLRRIYQINDETLIIQKERYTKAISEYINLFGVTENINAFSSPGRIEIIGNHTDHNHGLCVAASIDLDTIGIAAKTEDSCITIYSQGHKPINIDLNDIEKKIEEQGCSISLVRGIACRFIELGLSIGGFKAYTTSNVLKGSGLSSSAAFENLISTILNEFYNRGTIDLITIAKIGQYAENNYYNKPCGLLDQLSSVYGGVTLLDFADPKEPVVNQLEFDIQQTGCILCMIETEDQHNDLIDEYAAIPYEMKKVAAYFGKEVLQQVEPEKFYQNIPFIRKACGDRAVLRAFHYFNENKRVLRLKESIINKNYTLMKELITESGKSSFLYNQNVFSYKFPDKQGMSIALAVCDTLLLNKGAYRIHGGGFGGVVLAIIPNDIYENFKRNIDIMVGKECLKKICIRNYGSIQVF